MTKVIKRGDIYGRWKVIDDCIIKKNNVSYILCQCTCENKTIKEVNRYSLTHGKSKSCGCIMKDFPNNINKNGLSNTRLYSIWYHMKDRCYNPKDIRYDNYGNRGILICDEWLNEENGFINFYKWALKNGYKQDLTIDRIDVDKNYEPNNCRWVNDFIQVNNKTNNKIITIDGQSKTMTQWCKEYELDENLLYSRMKRGIKGKNLLKKPKEKRHSKIHIFDCNNKEVGYFFTKSKAARFIGTSSRMIWKMYSEGKNYDGYTATRD